MFQNRNSPAASFPVVNHPIFPPVTKSLCEAYQRKSQLFLPSGDRQGERLSWGQTNASGASTKEVSEHSLRRYGLHMEKHLITASDKSPAVAYDIVQNLTNRMQVNISWTTTKLVEQFPWNNAMLLIWYRLLHVLLIPKTCQHK
jgi:hypothetical protein